MTFEHKSVLLEETVNGLNISQMAFTWMERLVEADMRGKFVRG